MRIVRNQRGSITEFATMVPLVILTCFLVLQLLLLIGQRSESHAIADRIAFIAATTDTQTAHQAATNIKKLDSKIIKIEINDLGERIKVTLQSQVNLLIPVTKFQYEIDASVVKEPS